MGIPMLKVRRSPDSFTFNMEIHILTRRISILRQPSGVHLNKKMPSYQHMNTHYKEKASMGVWKTSHPVGVITWSKNIHALKHVGSHKHKTSDDYGNDKRHLLPRTHELREFTIVFLCQPDSAVLSVREDWCVTNIYPCSPLYNTMKK